MSSKTQDRLIDIIIYMFLAILAFIMLVPLLNVVSTSLSHGTAVDRGEIYIFPIEPTLASWSYIFKENRMWRSLFITISTTFIGVVNSLFLTSLTAYPLAKKEFKIGKVMMVTIVFTMIFRAPMIPYFLTLRSLGLYDSIFVLILPHAISAYNLIIMRTFFKQLPDELEEAAKIEGCGYFQMLFRIVIPNSKAVLATLGLFYAVAQWNQFLHPILFIKSSKMFPLQLLLRQMVDGTEEIDMVDIVMTTMVYNEQTVKAAAVIFAMLPIMMVYPFIQRYFVKGAMLGSVKG